MAQVDGGKSELTGAGLVASVNSLSPSTPSTPHTQNPSDNNVNNQALDVSVQGLTNIGNSCFLNSVVQVDPAFSPLSSESSPGNFFLLIVSDLSGGALSSIDDFAEYLTHCDKCTGHKVGTVISHMKRTLIDVHNPGRFAIVPEITKHRAVRDKFLRTGEQQDASEFLVHIFEWIEKELEANLVRKSSDLKHALLGSPTASPLTPSPKMLSNSLIRKGSPRSSPKRSPLSLILNDSLDSSAPPSPYSSKSASTSTSLADSQQFHDDDMSSRELTPRETKDSLSQLAGYVEDLHESTKNGGNKRSIFTVNPFSGLLESTVRCPSCHYHSTTYSEFLEITLPIIHHGTVVTSIEQSLDLFTSSDTVDWGCDACKSKAADIAGTKIDEVPKRYFMRRAQKLMTIARAPKLLYLHLHRLVQINGRLTKVDHAVKFKPTLVFDPFLSSAKGTSRAFASPAAATAASFMGGKSVASDPQHVYDLIAIIVHLGGAGGGHYVAYRKRHAHEFYSNGDASDKKKTWVYLSDATSKFVDEQEVLAQQAFMLYYVRRSS